MITRRLKLCTNVIMNIIVITKVKIAGTENIIATGRAKDINAITMKKGTTAAAGTVTEKANGAAKEKAPAENAKIPKSRLTED